MTAAGRSARQCIFWCTALSRFFLFPFSLISVYSSSHIFFQLATGITPQQVQMVMVEKPTIGLITMCCCLIVGPLACCCPCDKKKVMIRSPTVPGADIKKKKGDTKPNNNHSQKQKATTNDKPNNNSANDKPNNTQKDLPWQHVSIAKLLPSPILAHPPLVPFQGWCPCLDRGIGMFLKICCCLYCVYGSVLSKAGLGNCFCGCCKSCVGLAGPYCCFIGNLISGCFVCGNVDRIDQR